MKNKTQKYMKKDGGTIISLVIVLMLIFPFIVSGLIDITNCTMIKKTLKQELNSATKAAANSLDLESTRYGVYRIADGVVCTEAYGEVIRNGIPYDTNNYYLQPYNDASKIFYQVLSLNKLIPQNAWNNVNINIGTYDNGYKTYLGYNSLSGSQSSSPISTLSFTGDKTSKYLKRGVKVFFTVVNNEYYYNKEIENYIENNPSVNYTPITIPINEDTNLMISNDDNWANWNPFENTITTSNIYVNSYRPTAVGMAVIEYEPSKIFSIFGEKFKKIYIKEYATSELVMSNSFWQ